MDHVCLKLLSSLSSKASFGDFAPYLITNEASLDALNEELPMPVSMTRFRPNIVVRGLKAWEEVFSFLFWRKLKRGVCDISKFHITSTYNNSTYI